MCETLNLGLLRERDANTRDAPQVGFSCLQWPHHGANSPTNHTPAVWPVAACVWCSKVAASTRTASTRTSHVVKPKTKNNAGRTVCQLVHGSALRRSKQRADEERCQCETSRPRSSSTDARHSGWRGRF